MRKKCIQAGIKPKSIHACRRTFNSMFKAMGGNTVMASALLGHTREVNEKCYTYDVNDMSTKKEYIEKTIHQLTGV